jgi:hypothetical protein
MEGREASEDGLAEIKRDTPRSTGIYRLGSIDGPHATAFAVGMKG